MKPDFFSVTAGNLASIAVFVLGAAMVWQKMKDAIENLGSRIGSQESEMRELTKMGVLTLIQQHERRLKTLEDTVLAIAEIRTDVRWIKDSFLDLKEQSKEK